MKSVLSRSAVGRRVTSVAVLGLAATTLSLGLAGAANADPNTIELQGTVTGAAGAPLEGVDVTAVDATSGNDLETAVTDSAGHYVFDDDVVVGAVKVEFDPSGLAPTTTLTSSLPYQVRWSGGSRYLQGASVTTVATANPATPATVDINLPQYAAITGSLTVGADGHVADDQAFLMAYDADDNSLISSFLGGTSDPMYDSYIDPTTGNYRAIVDPSSPVRLQAYASDTNVNYLSQYWKDADTLAQATPIAVSSGQTVSGIDFRLTNALTARQAPAISGTPVVGQPLTATPGTWSRNVGTEFSYTWMRGATAVGTGATYTPTDADFGQQLTVVVQALNGEFKGQATSAATAVVRYPAEVRGKAKALSARKVRFAVKVVSAKQSPVKGKVVVMRGGKVVHKAVKLVKGRAVIVVMRQPKGKRTYTVLYKGNTVLTTASKNFTVRVHK